MGQLVAATPTVIRIIRDAFEANGSAPDSLRYACIGMCVSAHKMVLEKEGEEQLLFMVMPSVFFEALAARDSVAGRTVQRMFDALTSDSGYTPGIMIAPSNCVEVKDSPLQ